jgi:hypothetical protein
LDCNCSICKRIAGLWAYSEIENISIRCESDATLRYIREQGNIAFHTCKNCGCTTHWENLKPHKNNKMAVNLRLIDPDLLGQIRIRHFDGAETWQFLD